MRGAGSRTIVLCCFLLIGAGACGGGDQQTTDDTRSARTIPEVTRAQALPAGTYVTTEFEPAFSFRISEGWELWLPEIRDNLEFVALGEHVFQLSFNNPYAVYDPARPAEEIAIPEPENWVAWFRNHPYLDTGTATSVTIGGVRGIQFDTQVSPTPQDYPQWCQVPCVSTWPLSDGRSFAYPPDVKARIIIVEVDGEVVIIGVAANEAIVEKVGMVPPAAEEVLETVEW